MNMAGIICHLCNKKAKGVFNYILKIYDILMELTFPKPIILFFVVVKIIVIDHLFILLDN